MGCERTSGGEAVLCVRDRQRQTRLMSRITTHSNRSEPILGVLSRRSQFHR